MPGGGYGRRGGKTHGAGELSSHASPFSLKQPNRAPRQSGQVRRCPAHRDAGNGRRKSGDRDRL